MKHNHFFAVSILLLLAAISTRPMEAAASFTVTSVEDAGDANTSDGQCATSGGTCTLRAAVQQANAQPGADTIILPAGAYSLSLAGAGEDAAVVGDLDITDDLTIKGEGAGRSVVDGGILDTVFDVAAGRGVQLEGITIQNGSGGSAAGGIENDGSLTLRDAVVFTNRAATGAGGIANRGSLTLVQSEVSNNMTANNGGGIFNDGGMALTNVTISGNKAGGSGGGIANVEAGESVSLTNVTIANNEAPSGNAIFNTGSSRLKHTLVAGGGSANCAGGGLFDSQGYNLDNGTSCGFNSTGDIRNVDPRIGALRPNDGSSLFTHALLLNSPAIDAGDSGNCPPVDQRGFPRPADGNRDTIRRCDIGAYELQPAVSTIFMPALRR